MKFVIFPRINSILNVGRNEKNRFNIVWYLNNNEDFFSLEFCKIIRLLNCFFFTREI